MPTVTGRATDFITFSRTSNATVTGADGRIRWAGHNLLTNSESFDASAWSVKTGITVGSNSSAAPSGTTTADKIAEDNTGGVHTAAQTISISGGINVTYSVFAKSAERTNVAIQMATTGGTLVRFGANFDLTAKTVSKTDLTGSPLDTASSITEVGGGWYLCTLRMTTISTATSLIAYAGPSDSNNPSFSNGAPSYVGVTGNGALFWGAHLYRSDLGSMVLNPARGDAYYPTTPRNLLGFTEDFSNAAWTKAALTVTADAALAPNGLQTADRITLSSGTSAKLLTASASSASAGAANSTFSFYAKADGHNFIQIANNNGSQVYANFNLTAGAEAAGSGGSNVVSSSVASVGNGWWRCRVTFDSAAGSNTSWRFYFVDSATAAWGGTTSSTGSMFLWGAQLSDSASLDAYSPVYGAAVTSAAYYAPRLDYDAVTLAARGLLVEEQRVNLFKYSNDFSQSDWTKNTSTVTAASGTSPDGTNNAWRWLSDAGSTSHYLAQQYSQTSGRIYTVSAWVKTNTGSNQTFRMFGESTSASSDLTATTQWQRFSHTWTATSTSSFTIAGVVRNAANGASDLLVYGMQIDSVTGGDAPFMTSYIPTGASTATRTADVASVSTQAFPYSATEGTLVVGWAMIASRTGVGYPAAAQIDDGTNYVAIRQDGTADFRRYGVVQNGASTTAMLNLTAETLTAGTVLKAGLAYKANDFATTRGSTLGTASSGSVPGNLTTMRLGRNELFVYVNCWVRQVTYLPRRIANAELQARTV